MNEEIMDIYKTFFKKHFPEYSFYIDRDFDKIKIEEKGLIPFLLKKFKIKGICFFRKIYFVIGTSTEPDYPKLLSHELTHTIQYRREGVISFLIKYIIEHIKYGYSNNKYEEEAFYYEKMFMIWCEKEEIEFDNYKE